MAAHTPLSVPRGRARPCSSQVWAVWPTSQLNDVQTRWDSWSLEQHLCLGWRLCLRCVHSGSNSDGDGKFLPLTHRRQGAYYSLCPSSALRPSRHLSIPPACILCQSLHNCELTYYHRHPWSVLVHRWWAMAGPGWFIAPRTGCFNVVRCRCKVQGAIACSERYVYSYVEEQYSGILISPIFPPSLYNVNIFLLTWDIIRVFQPYVIVQYKIIITFERTSYRVCLCHVASK